MNRQIVEFKETLVDSFFAENLTDCEVGIVTGVEQFSLSHLIGQPLIRGYGQMLFPKLTKIYTQSHMFRVRRLRPGESLTIRCEENK